MLLISVRFIAPRQSRFGGGLNKQTPPTLGGERGADAYTNLIIMHVSQLGYEDGTASYSMLQDTSTNTTHAA